MTVKMVGFGILLLLGELDLFGYRPMGEASAMRERRSSSPTAIIMPAMAMRFGLGHWRDSGVLEKGLRASEEVKISVLSWPLRCRSRMIRGSR